MPRKPMPALSDEHAIHVICRFMEPLPELPAYWSVTQLSPSRWWELVLIAGREMQWYPTRLTLDRLREVEQRLTDKQWLHYGVLCWKWYTEAVTANDHEISLLNCWRRVLLHLSVEQKAKALAATVCTGL